MNEPSSPAAESTPTQTALMSQLVDQIIRAINDANEQAAYERVAKLKTAQPEASPESLVRQLIKQKCLQAGAVGAITSGMALIPGGGTLVTFTFGVTADLGLTLKMQAELVLEIAAVYERRLNRFEKRQAIILITGMGVAANQLLDKAGAVIARKATERLAAKSIEKALPMIGIAASGGKNILTTYLVGQRARLYFSQGPAAIGDWSYSLKTLTGVDAQQIITWLVETTERSWQLVSQSSQELTVATIVAGQNAGQVMVQWGGQAGGLVLSTGQGAAEQARRTTTAVFRTSKKLGQEAAIGANIAGWIATETGRGLMTAAASQTSAATRRVTGVLGSDQTTQTRDDAKYDIADIPGIPDQGKRISEITVDCYGQAEELAAFEVYFSDAMQFPFAATWRDPDELGHAESITVLDLAHVDERRGVLLQVQRGDHQRHLLAEQVWANDESSPNAIILDDYRHWVSELNGLTPGFE